MSVSLLRRHRAGHPLLARSRKGWRPNTVGLFTPHPCIRYNKYVDCPYCKFSTYSISCVHCIFSILQQGCMVLGGGGGIFLRGGSIDTNDQCRQLCLYSHSTSIHFGHSIVIVIALAGKSKEQLRRMAREICGPTGL